MLTDADRADMLILLRSQFEGATRASFEDDLTEKNWVVVVRDDVGRLRAFSTLAFQRFHFDGQLLWVAFSGDTVVEPALWKANSLAQAWIPAILQLKRFHRAEPLYWHLISSGFRTYRFLPALARRFYPNHLSPTPDWEGRLMQALSNRRFGECYNPQTGVVHPAHPYVLRKNLKGIPAERLNDPHISHFARLNPGYEDGDELVCLAQVSPGNLTPLARRLEARALDCEVLGREIA